MTEAGPTARRVRANIREIRDRRRVSLRALSERLSQLGHPLLASGLSKIETGDRGADVDDLVALALALDVAPNRLLLTGTVGENKIELTPEAEASESAAWRWATGDAAIPPDLYLWAESQPDTDLDRARRFEIENRPHDPPDLTPLADIKQHEDALAVATKACREAVAQTGLPRETVLNYVAFALRLDYIATALREE